MKYEFLQQMNDGVAPLRRGAEPSGISRVLTIPDEPNEIRALLEQLREEHRDLDQVIMRLQDSATVDQLQITRLKRRKLKVKDQITWLEDRLYPDIIA